MKNESANRDLLLRAAILYYEQNMTQEKVAKTIGVSRPAVSKILQQARDSNLVEFFVKDHDKEVVELELKIQEKYHLNSVRVVSTRFNRSTDAIFDQVGLLGAQYLKSILKKKIKIGIGWGNAISHFVDEVDYQKSEQAVIVPLVGGMGLLNLNIHANYLVSELASKLDSQYSTFYAPVIADTAENAKDLRQTSLVSSALKAAKSVDVAFIGIGNDVRESTWCKLGYITKNETDELERVGAIGDVVSDFFNSDGKTVKTDFSKRLIGITINDLKKISDVVVMAVGEQKAAGIQAMLDQGVINTLFIDWDIAENLCL
ncbi:sugar-binding transcriptional regulator [Lactiplantibacillus plajomi]|uniref:Sugar-binding transcriptional regulator n=1 Tax=Lactiplantibacillus plajomi TaxID=1457217 RepID=A0ABV6K2K4_9LACO|nr:sugar-binding domain-containing protein [Lactiplantibacillus plajomi]